MIAPDALRRIRRIYDLEATSFLTYVVEMSRPPVQDDADRQTLALLEELERGFALDREALGQVLLANGIRVDDPSWPLAYTSYHFLRPRYILAPLIERLRMQISRLESEASDLTGAGDEAAGVASSAIGRAKDSLARLEKLVASLPAEALRPGAPKGTSASRW